MRIALMCAEKDPATCHRSILVCKNVKEEIDDIRHILEDGTLEKHEEMEKRLMNFLKVTPDLLRDESECIEETYKIQEKKIAYTRENK